MNRSKDALLYGRDRRTTPPQRTSRQRSVVMPGASGARSLAGNVGRTAYGGYGIDLRTLYADLMRQGKRPPFLFPAPCRAALSSVHKFTVIKRAISWIFQESAPCS